jgi:hypothetical protein
MLVKHDFFLEFPINRDDLGAEGGSERRRAKLPVEKARRSRDLLGGSARGRRRCGEEVKRMQSYRAWGYL